MDSRYSSSFAIGIFWILFGIAGVCAQDFVLPGDQARELAYFGDVTELRMLCGPEKTVQALAKSAKIEPDALFQEAVNGEAWEVISLLVEYGWPAAYPNTESWSYFVSPRAVEELVKRVPDFQHRIGESLMLYATRQGNISLVKTLRNAGVPLGRTERQLAAAIAKRDLAMATWLLDEGANPAATGRESAISVARQLKSADLLALLDRKHEFTAEITQLREEHAPTPADAGLAGVWARPKDGFGSVVFVLYPDGTGQIALDIGSFPVLWNADAQGVQVADLVPSASAAKARFQLLRDGDALVLKPEKGGEPLKLLCEGAAYQPAPPPSARSRPGRLRLQAAAIDGDGNLWLGINGRHAKVELTHLIAGAKASNYGRDANVDNILDWENFGPGPVPREVLLKALKIPIDQRSADPGYSTHWTELFITHGEPAVLKPGSDYTLFHGHSIPVHLNPDPKAAPEYPYAFALLSKEPFSHGKRWILFFLRKGKADRSGP